MCNWRALHGLAFVLALAAGVVHASAPAEAPEVAELLTETDLQTIVSDNNFVAVFWRSGASPVGIRGFCLS